jgi:chromosome partitioning protein
MAIIAFLNQKGGCGKSTTAVHFAYWLAIRKKKRIVLVDADAQQSSSIWVQGMEKHTIPFQVISSPEALLAQLPDLNQTYQHVVADGPAGLAETTKAVLFRADLAIVPCQPTGVDLRSASDAVRLIQQAQEMREGLPKAAVFLSRAIRGTKLKDEATSLLRRWKTARFLKTAIHQRQSVADTSGQSATVWDLSGSAATNSAKEYDSLFKEILGMVR